MKSFMKTACFDSWSIFFPRKWDCHNFLRILLKVLNSHNNRMISLLSPFVQRLNSEPFILKHVHREERRDGGRERWKEEEWGEWRGVEFQHLGPIGIQLGDDSWWLRLQVLTQIFDQWIA